MRSARAGREFPNDPAQSASPAAPGVCSGVGQSLPRIQQQRGNAAVPQFPDGAIQNEVMNIHQRGENQKAGAEVRVEEPAGQPWSGNEKRDAASHQHREVGEGTPTARALCAGLTAGVVAGDPEILRRVHDRKHSAAVAALRKSQSLGERQHSRQKKPQALRGEKRQRRQQTPPTHLFCQSRPAVGRTADECHSKQQDGDGADPLGNSRRDKQGIVRGAGQETQKQDQVRNQECRVQGSSAGGGRSCAAAPGEHHEQAVILAAVVPRTPDQVKRENPGNGAEPEVRQNQRQHNEAGDVNRENPVFLKIRRGVIGAINRRHVMGIVEEQGQSVKRRLTSPARSNAKHSRPAGAEAQTRRRIRRSDRARGCRPRPKERTRLAVRRWMFFIAIEGPRQVRVLRGL